MRGNSLPASEDPRDRTDKPFWHGYYHVRLMRRPHAWCTILNTKLFTSTASSGRVVRKLTNLEKKREALRYRCNSHSPQRDLACPVTRSAVRNGPGEIGGCRWHSAGR